MKEYTILSAAAACAAVALDSLTGVRVLRRPEYYLFLAAVYLMKLLVNGYLTGAGIVLYDERFNLGLRLGSIPLEDFMFGFSMITSAIVLWEYFKTKLPG